VEGAVSRDWWEWEVLSYQTRKFVEGSPVSLSCEKEGSGIEFLPKQQRD